MTTGGRSPGPADAAATLNYAELALAPVPGRDAAEVAIVSAREDGLERTVTHADLRDAVGRAQAGLLRIGVRRGDRVVAMAPNSVETLVMFLAAVGLGAVWSSCPPDFGAHAARERFAQIEPTVLLAVDGYVYGGRPFDIRPTVAALRDCLPTLRATVLVPYLAQDAALDGAQSWAQLTAEAGLPRFAAVPVDHPLWVQYAAGPGGRPTGVVHGHGDVVLRHGTTLRRLGLRPGERLFWFTTTGSMMWNLLVGGLLVGSAVVLFDGSPGHPDLGVLWRLVQRHRVSYLGISAPFVQASMRAGLRPGQECDLSAVRAVGSAGAPLAAEGIHWIGDAVGAHIRICPVSGGPEPCGPFVDRDASGPAGEVGAPLGPLRETYPPRRPGAGRRGTRVRPIPSGSDGNRSDRVVVDAVPRILAARRARATSDEPAAEGRVLER